MLTSARSELEGLDRSTLSSSLLLTTETALTYLTELEQINQILMDSPDLLTQALGLGTETSYLVLAQNNDELRPSGGYLSTYGWLTLRNGRITDYSFSPTTTTSPNPPQRGSWASRCTVVVDPLRRACLCGLGRKLVRGLPVHGRYVDVVLQRG